MAAAHMISTSLQREMRRTPRCYRNGGFFCQTSGWWWPQRPREPLLKRVTPTYPTGGNCRFPVEVEIEHEGAEMGLGSATAWQQGPKSAKKAMAAGGCGQGFRETRIVRRTLCRWGTRHFARPGRQNHGLGYFFHDAQRCAADVPLATVTLAVPGKVGAGGHYFGGAGSPYKGSIGGRPNPNAPGVNYY